MSYGPWSPTIKGHDERCRQLRTLAGVAAVLLGSGHPLVAALRDGETDPMRFTEAQQILEQQVPTLTRRRLLATFSAVTWRPKPKE